LAFMAIKRIEKGNVPPKFKKQADALVRWFSEHKEGIIKGAWYPDEVFKDMSTGHILKFLPQEGGDTRFGNLPEAYNLFTIGKTSEFYKKGYKVESGNLADRCESVAQSINDNLKMKDSEKASSPIRPGENYIASLFFILSHYIADAHMPLHCDVRQFSEGNEIHAKIEDYWDDIIRLCYSLDKQNVCFNLDNTGYPKATGKTHPVASYLENEIIYRTIEINYGKGNKNTWDFMKTICQYSYLTSYKMIPKQYNENDLEFDALKGLNTGKTFDEYAQSILIDAIDSIVRVWLKVWIEYLEWAQKRKP
jgi:S1/P1 Nuclease.